MIIETPRIRLRCWWQSDREAFATMNADPEVMLDLGGPLDRPRSDAKLDRYIDAFERHGFSRWVIEARDGEFLGYAGILPSQPEHPLGRHFEIGWRLVRKAWGHSYATEAARIALKDAFERIGLKEVFAYTSLENVRSQAVMARLVLRREPMRDFTTTYGTHHWRGLVWVAENGDSRASAAPDRDC
jgi:RimJ/RimL family protein N-acetyltransferase